MVVTTRTPVTTDGHKGVRERRAAPSPRRNRTRIAAGITVLAVSALAAVTLYGNAGDRTPVLAVARAVEAGETIETGDLTVVRVAAERGVEMVPASERDDLVGRRAAVGLVPGNLLSRGALATGPLVPDGWSVIGAVLKPGQFPLGLRPGDEVTILAVPETGQGDGDGASPIEGLVVAIEETAPGEVSASLGVPGAATRDFAVAGAQGRLALARAPR
ncbi:MAG: SAF domain-containing protein [Actinobacteria bacterium]|nr:SAF domain-containing protein [Actinomycetota bacterium]